MPEELEEVTTLMIRHPSRQRESSHEASHSTHAYSGTRLLCSGYPHMSSSTVSVELRISPGTLLRIGVKQTLCAYSWTRIVDEAIPERQWECLLDSLCSLPQVT